LAELEQGEGEVAAALPKHALAVFRGATRLRHQQRHRAFLLGGLLGDLFRQHQLTRARRFRDAGWRRGSEGHEDNVELGLGHVLLVAVLVPAKRRVLRRHT
jgi:hypothetical protein